MIVDHLDNRSLYFSSGSLFRRAFEYLATFDPQTPDGRHDLAGDDLFILAQSFESSAPSEKSFEAHRIYADIHFIVSGCEVIWYKPTRHLRPRDEYDPARDVQFFEDTDGSPLLLEPGDFAVFWPQDGHKPCCHIDHPQQVRKLVAKIRVA